MLGVTLRISYSQGYSLFFCSFLLSRQKNELILQALKKNYEG